MASSTDHEPHGEHQTKKATASGWIGSALEYYDFFIYATAASLVFPQIFFPSGNPTVAIVASLATYGVGYVARPIGAFFLGHWGDTHGRKTVLLVCMFLMGFSTMAVGLLPTYTQVGMLAPALLVVLRLIQGFAVAGEISGASSMILEHAPFGRRGYSRASRCRACRPGRSSPRRSSCRSRTTCRQTRSTPGAGAFRSCSASSCIVAGYIIRREVDETPAFAEEGEHGAVPKAPIVQAFKDSWPDMIRVVCMALMNVIPVVATIFGAAYAVQPATASAFTRTCICGFRSLGNILAVLVIPFVGNLSDRIGRRPPIDRRRASARGCCRSAICTRSASTTCRWRSCMSLLMWGVVYQGYNAVFPSFYPELFPTRTRVSAMAIAQNIGTMITALLPALFAAVAPPGSTNIPLTIGAITLGVTIIAAIAAWSARETYRIHLNDLGKPNAVPVDKEEYERMRAETVAGEKLAKASA